MRRMVNKIMGQYGTAMTLRHGDREREVRAFFRAVNSRSWQSMEQVALPLGEFPQGQYTYIGPEDAAVSPGDTLVLGEKQYLFRRAEPYYYGDELVYHWGLCVEKGVEDTWGV